ncbi:STAS domain-containing protein [Streptomyces populi]
MAWRPAQPGELGGTRVDVPSDVGALPNLPSRAATLQIDALPDSSGLGVIGEISMNTRTAWRQALEQLIERRTGVVHLDMSQVRFVDVAGVTDLAVTAQRLPEGQRIVLHRPPTQLSRILELFWPGLAAIEVAA